jgi:hypothetical protein
MIFNLRVLHDMLFHKYLKDGPTVYTNMTLTFYKTGFRHNVL